MKISKGSWHFRYLRWWADPFASRVFRGSGLSSKEIADFEAKLPRSLCGYFWLVVAYITVFPALFLTFCLFVAAIGIAASPFVGIYHGVRGIRRLASRRSVAAPREPSLLESYLVAQKRRVCPLVTYTDAA